MQCKVRRVTLAEFNELAKSLGKEAETTYVPSTKEGCWFKGIFTNVYHHECVVAWPIDRPEVYQQEYSDKFNCGFPVESFSPREFLN